MDAMEDYRQFNANVHRGSYQLANEATILKTRNKWRSFINANSRQEVVFTKNATEAMNLISMRGSATY